MLLDSQLFLYTSLTVAKQEGYVGLEMERKSLFNNRKVLLETLSDSDDLLSSDGEEEWLPDDIVPPSSEDEDYIVPNKKRNTGRLPSKQPIPLKYPKWKDLQNLLPYIPPCYHSFYQNLPHLLEPHKKGTSKTQDPLSSTNNDLLEDWNILASHYEDDEQSSK
ncbi:hypothetical protein J6590_084930 [Homalodisca vitripennis]|nr:hypothetical protein J6590_084930 [Homalodisca vitripennis]